MYFRLRADRLSVLPADKLYEEAQRELMRNSRRSGTIQSTVGPVRGYLLHYAVNRQQKTVSTDEGYRQGTQQQLVGGVIKPTREPFGEPMQVILANDDWLDIELAGLEPSRTTVTVLVYPDSYAAYRQLKEKLYARGFATGAFPIEKGHEIRQGANSLEMVAQ